MSKTTFIGVLTIVCAVASYALGWLSGHPADMGVTIAAITSGVGLIHAADQIKKQ